MILHSSQPRKLSLIRRISVTQAIVKLQCLRYGSSAEEWRFRNVSTTEYSTHLSQDQYLKLFRFCYCSQVYQIRELFRRK